MNTAAARVRPQQQARTPEVQRTPLRIVENVKTGASPKKYLAVVILPMLALILFNLYLNALMAETAYSLQENRRELVLVNESNEALLRDLQVVSSPSTLEENAKRLGMEPAPQSLFISVEKQAIAKNVSDF